MRCFGKGWKSCDELFENSEKIVRDAYSRMNFMAQKWNRHQKIVEVLKREKD